MLTPCPNEPVIDREAARVEPAHIGARRTHPRVYRHGVVFTPWALLKFGVDGGSRTRIFSGALGLC